MGSIHHNNDAHRNIRQDKMYILADIPNTRKNRSMEPRMSTHGIAILAEATEKMRVTGELEE